MLEEGATGLDEVVDHGFFGFAVEVDEGFLMGFPGGLVEFCEAAVEGFLLGDGMAVADDADDEVLDSGGFGSGGLGVGDDDVGELGDEGALGVGDFQAGAVVEDLAHEAGGELGGEGASHEEGEALEGFASIDHG